jgi:hypothetical protein
MANPLRQFKNLQKLESRILNQSPTGKPLQGSLPCGDFPETVVANALIQNQNALLRFKKKTG